MYDRQPASGQAGRVLITPEDTSVAPYYATIEMADNPLNPGTPLNKATLLQDSTAALYGLGADAVPDQVLAKIEPELPQIGDIKYTVRSSLGSNWLLCDGSVVDQTEYPELFDTLAQYGVAGSWMQNINVPSTFNLTGVATNGTESVAASYSDTSGLYWAPDPKGPWSSVVMPYSSARITSTTYQNGYFIATYLDSANINTIAYSTSASSGYTQTHVASGTYGRLNQVIYGGGYYVAAGSMYSTARQNFWYASSLSGPWTQGYSTNVAGEFKSALYNAPYYLFAGNGESNATIYYTTSISGNLTTKVIDSVGATIIALAYGGGYYYALADITDSNDVRLYYSSTPNGTWNYSSVPVTDATGMVYVNGQIVVVGSDSVYTNGPTGPWLDVDIDGSCSAIAYGGNVYLVAYGNSSAIAYRNLGALPAIQLSGASAYIKAK